MVERRNIDEGTPTTMRSPGSAEASETQANAVEADLPRRRTGNATALRHLGRLLARTWIVLVLLVAWQLWIAVFDIHRLVMPPPHQVFLELVGRPTFYIPDILTTIYHASLGLLIGMLIGVALSLAAWYSRVLSGMVAPPALMLRGIPIVALTPIIGRLIGFNEKAVIAMAVLITIFPTFVFVSSGLRSASPAINDVFSALRAKKGTRLRRLALPAAVPSLLLSLRVSAGLAVLAALVAEWLMGVKGLGAVLSISRFRYEVATVWAAAIFGTTIAVAAFLGASRIEREGLDRFT